MDELERRRQVLLRRMASLDEELATLEAIPRDDYEDLTVIRFKLKFTSKYRGHSPYFNYAAIKIQGNWYLTGRIGGNTNKLTWAQLQELWANNKVKKLRIATQWSKLEDDTIDDDMGDEEAAQRGAI